MKQLSLLLSLYLITILFSFRGIAQDGQAVNDSAGPPYVAYSSLYFYDGSGNVIYSCQARSQQPSFPWTRVASTLTSIVVSSNTGTVTTSTAHGLAIGNKVTVTGATVASALNGTYVIQTVGSTTTFTITTAAVADGTYNETTLAISTTAPRSSAPVWDIIKYIYNGSGLLTNQQHAFSRSATSSICDNRATTTGATRIDYE